MAGRKRRPKRGVEVAVFVRKLYRPAYALISVPSTLKSLVERRLCPR